MELAIITLALLSITILSFIAGTIGLARYAFRLSTAKGIMVLLLPPYAFYFAFYELQQDGKDRATALWMFGIIATFLMAFIFQQPLVAALSGDMDALAAPEESAAPQKSVDLNPTSAPVATTPKAPDIKAAAPAGGMTATTTNTTATTTTTP